MIQSASIIVPPKINLETGKSEHCQNSCQFGVCYQNLQRYEDRVMSSPANKKTYAWRDYISKLELLRSKGVDNVILTGDIEPMGNQDFIDLFGFFNQNVLSSPFRTIELQTAGNMLDEKSLAWLRNVVGVTTISLSLSSFDDIKNAEITRNFDHPIRIKELCELIKSFGFILRLSLNMNRIGFPLKEDFTKELGRDWEMNNLTRILLENCKELKADQVTFRELYYSGDNKASDWVQSNGYSSQDIKSVKDFIKTNGELRGLLPFGAELYSYEGMSIVVDSDCMSQVASTDIKYLVLAPDCLLYRDWEKTIYG